MKSFKLPKIRITYDEQNEISNTIWLGIVYVGFAIVICAVMILAFNLLM